MTRAVDPFEEFLRKKKVEMLEEQVRSDGEHISPPESSPVEAPVDDDWTPTDQHADPQEDRRLRDEMTDFFERGADAGAELFAQAQEIDEDRVDEIKDALEDVFDAEQAEPEVVAEEDDTFIDFFKEVQTSFDPDLAELRREQDLAREVVQPPPEGAFEDEPLTAEFPLPEEMEQAETALEMEPEPEPEPMPVAEKQPFAPDSIQLEAEQRESVSTPALVADDDEVDPADADYEQNPADRLELSELLAPLQEGDDLRQRVDVLSRLVVKLVERSRLPESEIIEVLIKSGVGF